MFRSVSISIKLMIALGAMMSACGLATMVVLFSLYSLQQADAAEAQAARMSHAANQALAAAVEQQNAMRAYVATGDEQFLSKYVEPEAAFNEALRALDDAKGETAPLTAAGAKFHDEAQALMEQSPDDPGAVAVTAPTGIAATNVGGVTIHSWAGVGLAKGRPDTILGKVLKSSAACARWRKARVLVVDEVRA